MISPCRMTLVVACLVSLLGVFGAHAIATDKVQPSSLVRQEAVHPYVEKIGKFALGSLLHRVSPELGVEAVAFDPNGNEVATGSADNAITIWNVASGQAMRTFYYHTGKVNFIAYAPDGGMILTGSKDHRAVIWDPHTTYVDREFVDTEPVESVSFSRSGMFVITGSDNRLAKLWDTRSGQQVCVLNGHTGKVEAVAMNPEGGTAVTGSEDMTAKIWKVDECIAQKEGHLDRPEVTLYGHTGSVKAISFSPYGRWIITGSQDYTARIWDAKTGSSLGILGLGKDGKCEDCHKAGIEAVAWIPPPPIPSTWKEEDDKVATASNDGTVKLWQAHSGKLLHTFTHGGKVHSVAFDAKGERLVSGSSDGTAKIWSLDTYQIQKTLRGNMITPSKPFLPGQPQR